MGTRVQVSEGFTLVELMIVVLIIGILVAVAIPVFQAAKRTSQEKTCYANQRSIEGSVETWVASRTGGNTVTLTGVIDGSHPMIVAGILRRPPTCPAAPVPANRDNPTTAEGAYEFKADGFLAACAFGTPAHGHY